jgi:hypothetical protein
MADQNAGSRACTVRHRRGKACRALVRDGTVAVHGNDRPVTGGHGTPYPYITVDGQAGTAIR